jgi:hypothetical protein
MALTPFALCCDFGLAGIVCGRLNLHAAPEDEMKLAMIPATVALFASIAFAQVTEWPVVERHQRLFITVSIDGSYRYAVATASENGGERFPYRTISGKQQLETFGVGPGELHISVTRLDGKSTIHSVECPEERKPPYPNTVWRSRHYSSSNPDLTCRDKAEVVVTVASM